MTLADAATAFIALFVAMDVVGVLPMFLSATLGMSQVERVRVAGQATVTAAAVGLAFLFVGDAILHVLGITIGDFQIAGGVLLIVLAVYDIVHPELPLRQPSPGVGVVPLGIPMIVGPAVLTALLALGRSNGYVVTVLAFTANLLIVWAALRWASVIQRVIGESGSRALAKIANVLLAAIGAHLIRIGVTAALG